MDEQIVFWVGVAFAALLLLVVVYAIFKPVQNHAQPLLRLVGAVSAGASAFFISGTALVQLSGAIAPELTLLIKGTGGIALFILVWWQWSRLLPEGYSIRIPEGARFREVVEAIAAQDHATAEFHNFEDAQLNATMRSQGLTTRRVEEALLALRQLSRNVELPLYTVQKNGPVYRLLV